MKTTEPLCPHRNPSPSDNGRGASMTTKYVDFKRIAQNGAGLSFDMDGTRHSFTRVSLPDVFMEWVIEGRKTLF